MADENSESVRRIPSLRIIERVERHCDALAEELGVERQSWDLFFVGFIDFHAKLGLFQYGPITLDTERLKDELVKSGRSPGSGEDPSHSELNTAFATALHAQLEARGSRRATDLDFLLAFMRLGAGLPGRVFGELGVTPEQVEHYSRQADAPATRQPGLEHLFTPEEAADYLGVHVKTVRSWIRSGRLRANRLAGQRALRIRASDLADVLEPVQPAADRDQAE